MKTANKILAFFLSVVILSTLLVPPVFAADPTVEFSSTKTSVNTGDTFVVSIKATDTLTGVYSVGPLIRFDNTQLEVTNLKWNSSIPYAFPSTVETANTNGFFTTNYADNTTGAALDISAGDVFVEATFAVKSGASGSTEITTEAEFADEYGAGVAGAVLNQDKITITIVSGITGSLPISITAPAKGATPQSTISDTAQYTGTIVWEGSPATFAPSTVYTAKVELTAKSGYQFAASVNPIVAGADSITEKTVSSDGNTLTFKATFPATADKDTPTITTLPTASAITYGQTLENSTLWGGEAKFNSSTVAGTFAWETPSTEPAVADSSTTGYTVTFTPSDTATYASTTCTVKLTVNPKDVTATQSQQDQNVVLNVGDFTQPTLDDSSITVDAPTYSYAGATSYNEIRDKLAALSVGQTGDIDYTFAANGNYTGTITGKIHFTIVNLPAATVVTPPKSKTDLVYNGTEQALITAGVATGGTMQYSLDGSTWSDSIPKGKDAKPYTVYYRVKGDASHSDYIPSSNTVSVSIDKKPATVTPKSFTITKGDAIPTFELTYTGLVSGDTLTPSATPTFTCFESDGTTPVSTSTPAGTYTITWTNESTTTFAGEDNYDLTKTATATLTIENPSSGGVSTYAITVKDAENGNVTASRKSASKGTTVTLTVTPDKGYVLDTIKVLDSKDKEIKLTEKDGKFTFAMPASKVTVETSFKAEAPVVKHPFTDVPEGSWYEDAVIWAVDKGVTSGTSATTFDPDGICTRAQAVTFLWRAAGSPAPTTVSMPFTDVKAGSWYYDAVLWAVEKDITKGTSDITFSPDLNCSRGQIVTFLWRAAGSPAVSGNAAFTDVVADAYYAHAVLWAVKAGVTNGSSATTFSPDADCSRAQIVTFIYRHMTK